MPPALGSLHLQFFSFCRGQRLPTTPLYSLRTPSSPPPSSAALASSSSSSSPHHPPARRVIVDIAIAVVDLAKLLLPFFFGSVCSVLALYVSIYMLCWRRLHKWRIARGLVVGATTVISYLLFLS